MFVVIWSFLVREGCEAEFERLYGPYGEWSILFRTGQGYLGTELLHDESIPQRYLTLDRWGSPAAYRLFREANRLAYEDMDARCASLTESETELGSFETA